jgi:hypothetical protein
MTIQNAKIISTQTDPAVYHIYGNGEYRVGDKEYTMSRSDLMEFSHCPHRWVSGFEKKRTDALSYGNLLDAYVLDKERFNSQFVICPEIYVNDKGEDKPWNWNTKRCQEWRANREKYNKTIIKASEAEECQQASIALYNDPIITSFIESSDKQVMIVAEWKDESGIIVPLKCLIDLVPKKGQYLGDLKTCRTASNSQWPREVFNYGYHVQAAFYGNMYYIATGEARDGFVHILQENYPPYETGRKLISEEFIEIGKSRYENALKRYCHCLNTGKWGGYEDDTNRQIDGFTITEPLPYMMEPE